MILKIRRLLFYAIVLLALIGGGFGLRSPRWWWTLVVTGPLVLLGLWDILQRRHSVLRNYPLVGHLRFLLEDVGPELRQYMVESNTGGRPFNRDQRSLLYQRAKNVPDQKPFGTELDVYEPGYFWINHSMAPTDPPKRPAETIRITVGGPDCLQPYSASVLNISAMSFGALGATGIRALNGGARLGGFAHNTGEGGVSPYHLEPGGDLVWQIGTGYFGCRTPRGTFDPDQFVDRARLEQIRMIEIKISQGAKPGHGGVLPGAKVTPEIARVRGIPVGVDCISPPYHSAFSTPVELLEFVSRLRDLSRGKPVGFKLCLGEPTEFLAVCKAMIETGVTPDFVVVDGAEGGTGAAPLELSNYVGTPLHDGLRFVVNALTGSGVRDRIRIGASGKIMSGIWMAHAMAIGADWCNAARSFMFGLGCIQAQRCHTNRCPVGVATQDPRLQRALDVRTKAERVYHLHRNTVEALAEVVAAAGLDHPTQLTPHHIWTRIEEHRTQSLAECYEFLEPGQFLEGRASERLQAAWDTATPSSFRNTGATRVA